MRLAPFPTASVAVIALALPVALVLALPLALPGTALAQAVERPGDERPELPELGGPEPRRPVLPPLPPLLPETEGKLSEGVAVFVRAFRFSGATAFPPAELERAVAPWTGRPIRSEELAEAARAVTRLYHERGYVTSGAAVPDQQVQDGSVEIRVVEGALAAVEVRGLRHYRESVLAARLARSVSVPLEVGALEEQLQLLQQDERIRAVHARLRPGERLGEARLELEVEETPPLRGRARFANHEPPSIGGEGGAFGLRHLNPLGFGDEISAEVRVSDGLLRLEGRYALPVSPFGTSLFAQARYSDANVVEGDVRGARIGSEFESYGLGLRQVLHQSPRTLLEVGLLAEWRRGRSSLLGIPFSFPGSGSEGGESTVSVLRFEAEWARREGSQALAARSTVSVGVDALGATADGTEPDAEFVAWLGQLQWARRFEPWGIEALFRTDVQLASDALLTLEQFAVGGHATVRGYRENQLVRDQGVVASIEVRVPVWRVPAWELELALAPFVDLGHSWDKDRGAQSEGDSLASAGIGLRLALFGWLHGELYWGGQLESIDRDLETSGNLQDDGLSFALGLRWPR